MSDEQFHSVRWGDWNALVAERDSWKTKAEENELKAAEWRRFTVMFEGGPDKVLAEMTKADRERAAHLQAEADVVVLRGALAKIEQLGKAGLDLSPPTQEHDIAKAALASPHPGSVVISALGWAKKALELFQARAPVPKTFCLYCVVEVPDDRSLPVVHAPKCPLALTKTALAAIKDLGVVNE